MNDLDDLRRRVREALALMRTARVCLEENTDPAQAEDRSRRFRALLAEINGLFANLPAARPPDPEIQQWLDTVVRPAGAGVVAEGAGDDEERDEDATEEDEADEAEEGEAEEGEAEEEVEWELDPEKLGRAIQNEALMSKIPEGARAMFKRAAEYVVEAHERKVLLQSVDDAFDELGEVAKARADKIGKQLAVALTFERLANRRLD